MTGMSTESWPYLVALALLGGVTGVMLGVGFDRYAAWIQSRFEFPAWQGRYWRGAYVVLPFLVAGVALEALDGGPDSTAFIAGCVAGFVGHVAFDFWRWLRQRRDS